MNTENSPPNVRKRNLKVSYGDFDERGRFFYPFIRLHGKYLLQYGFSVGDIIEVSVAKGEITIKKMMKVPL